MADSSAQAPLCNFESALKLAAEFFAHQQRQQQLQQRQHLQQQHQHQQQQQQPQQQQQQQQLLQHQFNMQLFPHLRYMNLMAAECGDGGGGQAANSVSSLLSAQQHHQQHQQLPQQFSNEQLASLPLNSLALLQHASSTPALDGTQSAAATAAAPPPLPTTAGQTGNAALAAFHANILIQSQVSGAARLEAAAEIC